MTHESASASEQDKRRAEIAAAIKAMDNVIGLGFTVNVEDIYLLSDAVRCYRIGIDSGAIFCAHASCERDIAAMLEATGAAPAGSQRWGLGALVSYCAKSDLIPVELTENLNRLNEHRKTLYHYGHTDSETALRQQAYRLIEEIGSENLRLDFQEERGYLGDNKELFRYAMDRVLRQNALLGLRTAFQLRSWLA